MTPTLADFLAGYTATAPTRPATAFWPLVCYCGSDHFRLARSGSVTQCTCTRCATARTIGRPGDEWDAGPEQAYYCAGCGGDRACVCLGFAGARQHPEPDVVQWFYIGVRCCDCNRNDCFNGGPVSGGSMSQSFFREIAGD